MTNSQNRHTYLWGGGGGGQNKDSQKNCLKKVFLRDTDLDQLVAEQAGTPNFKSLAIFNMFTEKYGA